MNRLTGRVAAVVLALTTLLPAVAGAQVVVSQVYGGGGNSGATLRSDFIELRNNGAAAVSLDGWSVQYASSSGSSWQVTPLAGSIAPGGYYLVKQADGAGGTTDLPAPDASGSIAMSGSNGKVALVHSADALSGACPLAATVDFVGYGSANCFEGAGAAPGLSNTTAALRGDGGSVDTGNNAADFSRGAPEPRNSGAEPPPPPDPATPLTIAQIQGAGLVSAHVDERVVTEGVVTARKFNNGFFLQAANDDGDPATSDAVFVFTGSAPPASAAVGNRVRVTGTVSEFLPPSNPNQLTITEIVEPSVELLATGNALPAPVELNADVLGADAQPGTAERLEAMRVSVAHSVVVGPSEGRIDENDALSFTDGVFYVTLPQVTRPFREPGIGVLDRVAIPAGKAPPRFDTNPERLMVRSRGQIGAEPLSVDVQAQVDGLLGVLDYFDGTWALLPDAATPPAVSGGMLPQPVPDADYDEVTIGSFNLLRFFDEVDDDNGAVTLTPEALDKRLGKTAAAICDYLKAPDILGVVEVENRRVLGLLADRIQADCPRAPAYVPYLVPGNDVGGINVGFLVSTRGTGAMPRVEVLDVVQFGKDATITNPDGSTDLLNDRPPLLLRARVHQDNGASYPVTVIVNHLRSLNDIDSTDPGPDGWPTDGDRVRAKRGAQAAYLAGLVESLQQANPDEHIVLVGDFNAFQFNDGYVDLIGVIEGDEAPPERVLTWVDSPLTSPLLDGSAFIDDPAQRYSYVFEGSAQSLDHVLVNAALIDDAAGIDVEHARINADFGLDHFGDASLPLRVSDHDPVRLSIAVAEFRSADLSVVAGATPAAASPGEAVRFDATVANAGPNPAEAVGVAFVFDAVLAPAVTAPDGWSCDAPVPDTGTTTVSCHAAALAAGATAAFALDVLAPQVPDDVLRLSIAVASHTRDPANGDNQATVELAVPSAADLSVRLLGKAMVHRRGAIATFLVPVANAGPDAALQPRLTLQGNVAAALAAVAAPDGWTCTAPTDTDAGFRAECSSPAPLHEGTRWFAFAIVVPERPRRGAQLEFDARIESDTRDPDPGDNQASYASKIRGRSGR